jgi:cell division protein FtsB
LRQNFRLTPDVQRKFTEKLRSYFAEFHGTTVAKVVRKDGLKLADGAWACYRLSGTEPVVRVYTEARSPEGLEQLRTAVKSMDLQLGPPSRARILPNARENVRSRMKRLQSGKWTQAEFWIAGVSERAPKAEALASRCIVRTRPVWSWFAAEWRRLGTLIAALLTIGLLLHAVFGANGMVIYRQKRDELKVLQGEVDRIQKENDAYAARIKALKSDPNAIEKEAREQLHYTRPGEMIYIVPEAPQKPATGRAKSGK